LTKPDVFYRDKLFLKTAGSGIIHQEMPKASERLPGCQMAAFNVLSPAGT